MIQNINKLISVWRGDNTPPTDYHLWQKSDGGLFTKIDNQWKQLISIEDKSKIEELTQSVEELSNLQLTKVRTDYSNVLAAYQLKSGDKVYGTTINIYKDLFLKDVKLGYSNGEVNLNTGEITIGSGTVKDTLIFSLSKDNGKYEMIAVDLVQFLTANNISDGLKVEDSKIKVKVDPNSEYLSVSNNGIKVSGIKSDFNELKDNINRTTDDLYNILNVHQNRTDNPHSVTKSQVGLSNVTNDAQVKRSEMGVASGVATLDNKGKVPSSQLPSYVDDVEEYETFGDFPTPGESGKIYVATETNLTYRWTGTQYTEISPSIAIGETENTAFAGSRGVKLESDFKTLKEDYSAVVKEVRENLDAHIQDFDNPHKVTKSQVGLGSVDNTSDLNKPISTATQTALNNKVDKEDGKVLSSNDYTTEEKTKLASLEVIEPLAEADINALFS